MPRLPRLIATEAIKALEKLGFVKVRQKRSHVIMEKQLSDRDNTQIGCVVPLHNKTLFNGQYRFTVGWAKNH